MQTMNAKVITPIAPTTKQKRQQYAIDLPKNEDCIQDYVHDGTLPDDKYRFPWKRGRAESYKVLIKECATVFEDGAKFTPKEAGRISDIEPLNFDSQTGAVDNSVSDGVNFELDFDVIPSSNPSSSQDIFTPDEFIETYNEFDEIFEKENLDQFSTITCDSWKIDTVGYVDTTFSDALQTRPTLSELATKLETFQVEDPLLLNNENSVTENGIFRSSKDGPSLKNADVPMLQQTFDSNLFDESYAKMIDDKTEGTLEDVMTDEYDWSKIELPCLEPVSILQSVTGPKTRLIMEGAPDIIYVVSKQLVKQQYEDVIKPEHLVLDLSQEHASTFLDINEIIVTEQDKFCEMAVLDVPGLQTSSWLDPHYVQQLKPKIEKVEIETEKTRLLNSSEKQDLQKALWQSEKYCDEIQANQLPEPNLKKHLMKKEDTIKQVKEVVGNLTELNTGKAELELSWEIVKSIDRVTDPCKILVPYVPDGEIGLLEDHIAEVERFDKYSSTEVYETRLTTSTLFTKDDTHEKPLNKASKVKIKVKPLNTPCDPLDAFMALRSKTSHVVNKQHPERVDSSDNNKVLDQKQNDKTAKEQSVVKEPKPKMKHHCVKIQLTEELHQILELLQRASGSYITELKRCGALSSNTTFLSITPDVSRFILKQREKYIEDNKLDRLTDTTFKLTVILHGLVGAADLAVNCCLESAIGYMNALQEKYKDILEAMLDPVRQKLFQLRATFYQKNTLHPKVVSLCKEVEKWLRNKRAKSKDCEQKILVLIKHDMPSLMSCLKHALCLGNMLTPEVLSSTEPESVIRSLDQHNCLIAPCRMLADSFPWAQFCLVVEYEYMEDSEWQQLCERQHIRHIGLYMHREHKIDTTEAGQGWTSLYPDKQISVIGSTKITKTTDLLQLLEGGQNLLLVERDYDKVQGGCKPNFYSDIDVDANTGIVLENLKDMGDDCMLQHLVVKMAALCLKYVSCWLILFSSSKSDSYIYQSHVISNIAKIHADIANTVHHSSGTSIKVVICSGYHEVASLIRNICEDCMTAERNKPVLQWLHRDWLSEDVSKEEAFLLSLPCLNSFSAQLLIHRMAMKRIFTNSATKLSQLVPEIDAKILKALEMYVNNSTGLHLRETQIREKYTNTAFNDETYKSSEDTLVAKLQKQRQHENPPSDHSQNSRLQNNVNATVKEQKSHYFKTLNTVIISKSNDDQDDAVKLAKRQDVVSRRFDLDSNKLKYKPVSETNRKQTVESTRKRDDMCDTSVTDRVEKKIQNTPSGLFQNVIKQTQPCTTYEYNHGLPYIVPETEREKDLITGNKRTVHYPCEENECVSYTTSSSVRTNGPSVSYSTSSSACTNYLSSADRRLSGYNSNYRPYESLEDLEKEFPSIETINKSLILEAENEFYCPEMDLMDVHKSFDNHISTISSKDQFMLDEPHYTVDTSSIKLQGTRYQRQKDRKSYADEAYNIQPEHSKTNINQQVTCTDFQNSAFDANTTENFNFQPKIFDTDYDILRTDKENKGRQPVQGLCQQVYVNPQIKRLSRKQKYDPAIEEMVNAVPTRTQTSLADDLKETTRKVLENSQQFSSFALNSKRRPLQHMRIGLAQPLMREMKTDKIEPVIASVEEQGMMDKSLWTVGNSPPMDLDYDSCSTNDTPGYTRNLQQQDEYYNFERSNKAVFTSQTPNKKRKLTFQPVAGRKGQTKLVFR